MAEIEAELGNKPDIVRLVHTNRWKLPHVDVILS